MNNDGLSCATAQRGWNSGLDSTAALSAAEVGDGGGGDSHAMSSGQEAAHSCADMERVDLLERRPIVKPPERKNNFEDMVSRVRSLAMTRMINETLTARAWKKAFTVQTVLAKTMRPT